jgi:hypothetical protein
MQAFGFAGDDFGLFLGARASIYLWLYNTHNVHDKVT